MSWSNRYIGIPWRAGGRHDDGHRQGLPGGLDCWGLLRCVYARELQLKLPAFDGTDALDAGACAAAMQGGLGAWREVLLPQPFDGVLLRKGRALCHVGVVVRAGWFLHVDEGEPAHLAAMTDRKWRSRIAGFYRHAAVNQASVDPAR